MCDFQLLQGAQGNEESTTMLCIQSWSSHLQAHQGKTTPAAMYARTDSPQLLIRDQMPKWFCCFDLDHLKLQLTSYSRWKLLGDLETPANRECPYSLISQNFMQKSSLLVSHRPILLLILLWNSHLKNHHNLAAKISFCIDNLKLIE